MARFLALAVAALGLVMAVPAFALAKLATPELIDRAEARGQLDRHRADLLRAYALARPGRVPADFRSDAPWDGTPVLLELRRGLPQIREAERREIEALFAAGGPGVDCSNKGKAQANVLTTTHFYLTYSSVAGGLSAAAYAASLERSWDKEVSQFGWAAPPVLASAPPPGDRYHVRIDDLSLGLYGFVSPVGDHAGFVGNNPSTAWNDGDAYATCMVLNRDYSGFPSSPQAALDSTTAHELNHSIQYGYGALVGENVPDDVFVEGGATWMEDEVHDVANDNYNYLWPVFGDSMGDYGASPYPYWITFRGFTERYGTGGAGGGEQVMQEFWERTSRNLDSNLDAMHAALTTRGTTLADAFHAYAVAVKLNRPCGGGYAYPYCFEEASGYLSKAGPTAVHATIGAVGGSTTSSVEDNYAVSWVALPASGSAYNVTLANGSAGGQLRGTVACDTGSGLSLSPLPSPVTSGQSTTLTGFTPSGCASRVLVVTNQSQTAANPTSSAQRSFSVSTSSAGGTTHTLSVTRTGSGSGTVTSSPGGIDCGADCSQAYAQNTSVTLTATPAAGSSFAGWSGACAGTGSCTVTMSTSGSVGAGFELLPDETPPETSITGGPEGDTSDSTPTFTFVSSEPSGSTFSCRVDGGTATACGSPYTTSVLPEGPHTFSVAATDAAGNVDPTPATRDFTVVAAPVTPSGTVQPPATAQGDLLAPAITRLRLSPAMFRAARSGPALAAFLGTRISLALSEAATVTFRISRLLPGRRVGGRCVRPDRRTRTAPRCTRALRLRGRIARKLPAGSSRLRFRGRVAGRTLQPGRYQLIARARDDAGNRSARRRVTFVILR